MSRPNTPVRPPLVWAVGAMVLVAVSGCGRAVRFIRQTPDGGTITMPTNTNQWPTYYRKQAEALMHAKCPEGYRIDREGALGGEEADPSRNRGGYESYFGYTGGSEAEQEYHITFHGAAGKLPPPTNAPAKPDKRGSSGRSPSPSAGEATEELPPPRPVTPPNERKKDS